MTVYIDTSEFNALALAIAGQPPCQFTGRVTEDQIKIALGEIGDVWPIAIMPLGDHRELIAKLKPLVFTAAHSWQRSIKITRTERDVLVDALSVYRSVGHA